MSTPELEKAAAVIERIENDCLRFLDNLSGYEDSILISYIASAIREAQASARDDALEEAAAQCAAEAQNCVGGNCDGLQEAASICRNLKTKD